MNLARPSIIDIIGALRFFTTMIFSPNPASYDRNQLLELVGQLKCSDYNAKRIFKEVYRCQQLDPQLWQEVAKDVRKFFRQDNQIGIPEKIIHSHEAMDGTTKLLIQLRDNKNVESVIIPQGDKTTLCVSSQVGCAMGCTFCHTGAQGLSRHLLTEEILAQFILASARIAPFKKKITNIVFMGMGEPLHNWANVKKACEVLQDDWGAGLGKEGICISSVGLDIGPEQTLNWPKINLALSLHSAQDAIRSKIVPMNKNFSVDQMIEWGRLYASKRKRKTFFELTIIKDLNHDRNEIDAITKKLSPQWAKLNLIPFNPWPGQPFQRPEISDVIKMQSDLIAAGFVVTIRKTRGDDILGACGQLNTLGNKRKRAEAPQPIVTL